MHRPLLRLLAAAVILGGCTAPVFAPGGDGAAPAVTVPPRPAPPAYTFAPQPPSAPPAATVPPSDYAGFLAHGKALSADLLGRTAALVTMLREIADVGGDASPGVLTAAAGAAGSIAADARHEIGRLAATPPGACYADLQVLLADAYPLLVAAGEAGAEYVLAHPAGSDADIAAIEADATDAAAAFGAASAWTAETCR